MRDEPGNIPALHDAYDAQPAQAQWTPTLRTAAGAAGASLLLGGLLRRNSAGIALGALVAGLIAVGATGKTRRKRAPQPAL